MAPCPNLSQLQDLLSAKLSADDQVKLTGHLDSCESCRQRLEEMAGGPGPCHGAEEPVPQTLIEKAIDALESRAAETTVRSGAKLDEELSLDFLAPSKQANSLGVLGSYEVLEVIGRGGMGVVLKAQDPALNRYVAIKVVAPHLASSVAARRRFAREAQAAAAISHDHVVTIHGVDEKNSLAYLVMQYVPGITLQDKIDRTGPLELKEILRIGMQAASGLAAAHAQGLVHRDIKPSNILLENGVERVKITDFGLARAIDDSSLTQSGMLAGTPEYMAPEQARGELVDHRADLFSLGSVLYAMCTGRPPFRANHTPAVLRRVEEETPRPIRESNPDIPDWLVGIIARLHAKNPSRRYQSAAEVAGLLCQHLAHLQQPSIVPLPQEQRSPSPSERTKLSSRWIIAAAILLLLGLGVTEATGHTELTDLVATVLRIKTPHGTLIVEVEDPSVKVLVDDDGKEISISGGGVQEIRLRPGPHLLRTSKDGKEVTSQEISISRGKKQVVRITSEPPTPVLASPVSGKVAWPAVVQPRPVERAPTKSPTPGEYGVQLEAFRKALQQYDASIRITTAGGMQLRPHSTLAGHQQPIWAVAFSPDGQTVVSTAGIWAGEPGEIIQWDVATGKIRWRTAEGQGVRTLTFSRDGSTLAAAGYDGIIKLYDLKTGKLRAKFAAHDNLGVNSIALSADGKLLASGGLDNRIHLWDIQKRKQLAQVSEEQDWVLSVAFSPDGRYLASATKDGGLVKIWDVATRKIVRALQGHEKLVEFVTYSPDGQTLATASWDGTVVLWETKTGKERARLSGHEGAVWSVAFSPDGKLLATCSGFPKETKEDPIRPGGVNLWDAKTGQILGTLKGHAGQVTGVAFSPDGKRLASASWDQTIKLWDIDAVAQQPFFDPAQVARIRVSVLTEKTKDGKEQTDIRVEGQPVTLENLKNVLADHRKQRPGAEVRLEADANVEYKTILEILKVVQETGAGVKNMIINLK